ncbi:MAG: methyltransferase domain-containing protein [Magnetococcales bacterium]|nr:methyltransferase domain-containing protein [Magnetococcales bacterium]
MKGIYYKYIPIFINSFNRKKCLSLLVDWLLVNDYKNILIIDNASTYPPLLEYFTTLEKYHEIKLIRLEENLGHECIWKANLLESLNIDSEFVYTDPDILPDEGCPSDVVGHLQQILIRNPSISKVGIGIRIDDLPECNRSRRDLEMMFFYRWRKPAMPGLFWAPVDTVFALYRPFGSRNFSFSNTCTGYPYYARHLPWYTDSDNLSDEDLYYGATTATGVSHFLYGRYIEPIRLHDRLTKEKFYRENTVKLLHLCCGKDYFFGWINLDSREKAEIQFDLNACNHRKIPLFDDSIDGFYLNHCLQNVRDPLPLMAELWRVAKNNARMIVRVPHGSSDHVMASFPDVRPYFESSFNYFSQPVYTTFDYGYKADWSVEKIILHVDNSLAGMGADDVYRNIKTLTNRVHEMIVFLRAIKPERDRWPSLIDKPKIILSFSSLIPASDLW